MSQNDFSETNIYEFEEGALRTDAKAMVRMYVPCHREISTMYSEELFRGSFGEEWPPASLNQSLNTGSSMSENDLAYILG